MSQDDRPVGGPVTPAPVEGAEPATASPGGVVSATDGRRSARRQLGWVVAGVAAVILGMAAAGSGMLATLLEPPFPAGLLLGAAAGILGVLVVLKAIARIGPARDDARELIRAVRLIFVAVGLFAAAAGWIVGSALPIVVGLIIVGIDVIETSFLLVVTAARPEDAAGTATEKR